MSKDKKMLLVIDVQNGFTSKPWTNDKAKEIVKLTNSGQFDYIVATQFVNVKNSPYQKIMNWQRLKNKPETDLFDGLKYDASFKKFKYSAVTQKLKDLIKKYYKSVKPEEIYICGIDTDCCVQATAINLFEKGIRPIVLSNYCASNGGLESHEAALKTLSRAIGKENIIQL